mmetsp:Transcript_19433/g.58718  ORF Transcript_19433/g.58718 Transcript_19433/m.58718 type:complete len:214 (-) Transcript_19433:1417-2058(-)
MALCGSLTNVSRCPISAHMRATPSSYRWHHMADPRSSKVWPSTPCSHTRWQWRPGTAPCGFTTDACCPSSPHRAPDTPPRCWTSPRHTSSQVCTRAGRGMRRTCALGTGVTRWLPTTTGTTPTALMSQLRPRDLEQCSEQRPWAPSLPMCSQKPPWTHQGRQICVCRQRRRWRVAKRTRHTSSKDRCVRFAMHRVRCALHPQRLTCMHSGPQH